MVNNQNVFIIPDLAQIEESASRRLLDKEEEKKQKQAELDDLEEQLKQCTARSQISDSELQYPFFAVFVVNLTTPVCTLLLLLCCSP